MYSLPFLSLIIGCKRVIRMHPIFMRIILVENFQSRMCNAFEELPPRLQVLSVHIFPFLNIPPGWIMGFQIKY